MLDLSINPSSSMTTRELRAYIREATKEVNKELIMSYESPAELKKDNPLLYQQRNKLIELGTGKEYRGGVGLGLTYKTKIELVLQARALKETFNIIAPSEQTEKEEERVEKAYETFVNNRPGITMSESEYKEMTETLGAIGTHVFNEFGYESFIETYDEARDEGKNNKNVVDAMVQTIREARGQSWTTEDMINSLRDKLDL